MLNYNAPADGIKSSIDGSNSGPDEHFLVAEKCHH